ncbi:hypothetical protein RND71_010648 [Anisodus tanguticus]|uniref:Alanine aminotransferase n=1 Tax=Anisodus tanguticus TaxID=243964 RepID=A0AAE1SHH4_9SOLA|nr:hypothetical protein RND71_010648 [Anisodus tanguticus]
MVIINPGTPIGQCLTEANLPQILQLCYQEKLLLLGDEVYHHSQVERPYISAHVLLDMGLPISKELQLTSFHIVSKGYWGEYGQRRGYFELTNLPPKTVEENDKVSSISLSPNLIGCLQIASGVLLCGVLEFEKPRCIFSLTQRIVAYFNEAILSGLVGFGYGIIGQEIANLMQLCNSYRTLFGQLDATMDDVEAVVSDAIVYAIQAEARHLLEVTPPEIPKPELPHLPEIPTLPKPELPHLPEIPTLPKPEFPDIPKPELPTLPKPELPEIPKPELPTPPMTELPKIPKPEFPTFPKPELPTLPKLEMPAIPKPELPALPKPEIPQVPKKP